jgi:hypothetical protein
MGASRSTELFSKSPKATLNIMAMAIFGLPKICNFTLVAVATCFHKAKTKKKPLVQSCSRVENPLKDTPCVHLHKCCLYWNFSWIKTLRVGTHQVKSLLCSVIGSHLSYLVLSLFDKWVRFLHCLPNCKVAFIYTIKLWKTLKTDCVFGGLDS